MNKIILDASKFTSKEEFHTIVKEKFDFPDYYGNNLDGLWDLLTERRNLDIDLINIEKLDLLGNYGKSIFKLFDELNEIKGNDISFFSQEEGSSKYSSKLPSPKINSTAFIADGAKIMGKVKIAKNASVWYNAVLRGDDNRIVIGENSNVQDNAVIHMSSNSETIVGQYVTIGHSAIVHGAILDDNVLVGMGAIILDNAHIGKNSIVGAGSLVTKGKEYPEGSLIMGSPAKFIRKLSQEEIDSIKKNAEDYVKKSQLHRLG